MYIVICFSVAVPEEICVGQSFTPHCGTNEVVFVTSAKYGRMSLGQCIQSDFMLGCQGDAMQVLDRSCSGRYTCSVEIGHDSQELKAVSNCPPDVYAYLEVEYNCVPGLSE